MSLSLFFFFFCLPSLDERTWWSSTKSSCFYFGGRAPPPPHPSRKPSRASTCGCFSYSLVVTCSETPFETLAAFFFNFKPIMKLDFKDSYPTKESVCRVRKRRQTILDPRPALACLSTGDIMLGLEHARWVPTDGACMEVTELEGRGSCWSLIAPPLPSPLLACCFSTAAGAGIKQSLKDAVLDHWKTF